MNGLAETIGGFYVRLPEFGIHDQVFEFPKNRLPSDVQGLVDYVANHLTDVCESSVLVAEVGSPMLVVPTDLSNFVRGRSHFGMTLNSYTGVISNTGIKGGCRLTFLDRDSERVLIGGVDLGALDIRFALLGPMDVLYFMERYAENMRVFKNLVHIVVGKSHNATISYS